MALRDIHISARVKDLLSEYGWFPDRFVDVSKIVDELADNGWVIFDTALQFMQSFEGLPISGNIRLSEIAMFSALDLDTHKNSYRFFEDQWGKLIYPIGTVNWSAPIFIDSDGIIMTNHDNIMYICEKSLGLAFEQLLFYEPGRIEFPTKIDR